MSDTLLHKLLAPLITRDPGTGMNDSHALLTHVAQTLQSEFQIDLVVAYELIPETGGVPRLPPICIGSLQQPQVASAVLATASHAGMLGDFIRHGQLVAEPDAASWCEMTRETADYSQFIACEQIASFLFVPLCVEQANLGALFLNFRQPMTQQTLPVAAMETAIPLLSLAYSSLRASVAAPQNSHKRMAMAHTYYGGAVAMFKGQVDTLQTEMERALGSPLPRPLLTQLDAVKHTVFDVMRNLVIDVSGDVLIDLEEMSLEKALRTTAAALRRAWPEGQRVTINISPLQKAIERQPPSLRRLLYALVLEAMGNAIKHGGPAPFVHVDIIWAEGSITVQVIDHGCGFDRQTQPLSPHGLGFWVAYLPHLGGEFRVASQTGFGTVVTACVPVLAG